MRQGHEFYRHEQLCISNENILFLKYKAKVEEYVTVDANYSNSSSN